MNEEVLKLLNDQITLEHESAYAYLIMSAYFEEEGFQGFAKWARKQSDEEMSHMMKIYHYLYDRQADIQFATIHAIPKEWASVNDVFKDSLKQEQKVTASIHTLLVKAREKDDFATQDFLQWFVKEQVEEEAAIHDILHKFSLIGENKAALIMLDKDLGERED